MPAATFYTILTDIGRAKLAAAVAGGATITLTEMAVGDGLGNPTTPDPAQTALLREKFRDNLNQLYESTEDDTLIVAELAIPMGTGGWGIHEVGVFDTDGELFAVANFPATYKPAPGDGADRDLLVRVMMKISNAGSVTLILDPAAILASREWVINNFTFADVLPGGTTGQVLTKQSNADGDADWQDPTDVNVTVDTIEENQTLAALQTAVELATVTTTGLAVYIAGTRLRNDEWTAVDATNLTLDVSYPDGTKATFVQNEPAGLLGQPLQAAQNLSDVASAATSRTNLDVYSKAQTDTADALKLAKASNLADLANLATARTNLSVYSKAEADQLAPAGEVALFANNNGVGAPVVPGGWVEANGQLLNRITDARLFAAIGTYFGVGDGSTTFGVPDLRGDFLRAFDHGRGVDPGRTFGVAQGDQNKDHNHGTGAYNRVLRLTTGGNDTVGDVNATGGEPDVTSSAAMIANGGTEARPRNTALLVCIRR